MTSPLSALQAALARSQNIIAVAGAGLSAGSGIPTFRGAGGYWRSLKATELATPEAFDENPSLVWQFYHYRREKARLAQPNRAHYTLSKLCIPRYLHEMLPAAKSFTLITQNVDGLSERALRELCQSDTSVLEQANKNMIEMHGKLFETICTSCGDREMNYDSPICPALGEAESDSPLKELPSRPEVPVERLPQCTKCGSLTRPGVVWFGEEPHHMNKIDELLAKADFCLVVGTSSTVYPAAGYAFEVQANGGKVAVFNLARSQGDDEADFLIIGPCEETLEQAMQIPNV